MIRHAGRIAKSGPGEVRSAADIDTARKPTQFPPRGDRSLFGPVRAHHREGMLVHMLGADQRFVVAIQLEKAPIESWDHLLELDFHSAVLSRLATRR
jgi:2-keto-3-deoxy-L-rhamnonate aldolase RhmA